MKGQESLRERSCTRKRAFKTRLYAEQFLWNVLKRGEEMNAYQCRFCGDWHIGTPGKYGQRQRDQS